MNKLFFILFISLFGNKFDIIAQIILRNDDIVKLTIENFPESMYYKALKTRPEIQTSLCSAKTIDSGCISYQTKEFDFKKEKISFEFRNNYDSTKTNYLESITIKGEHTPFMTEDSINVGDKILLKTICKDIAKLKAQYEKRNDKYVTCIFYNNITYDIYRTLVEEINSETVVKIKEIHIRTYKEIFNGYMQILVNQALCALLLITHGLLQPCRQQSNCKSGRQFFNFCFAIA